MPKPPSHVADKYIVRLPDGMRDRIADAAKANNRSMNAEIVARLERSFSASAESAQVFDAGYAAQLLAIQALNVVAELPPKTRGTERLRNIRQFAEAFLERDPEKAYSAMKEVVGRGAFPGLFANLADLPEPPTED